ncbi:MAG: hypothetical protein IPN90_09200 [Elusimicrobia bacterium]|nr:hypothetical protein [Elusimicrobiota bacterium]
MKTMIGYIKSKLGKFHRSSKIDLLVASFLLLFLELALIRWVSASAFIMAYFANIILVGCFLGFGIGCSLKNKRPLFTGALLLLFIILLSCRLIEGQRFANPFSDSEFIFSAQGSFRWTAALMGLYVLIVFLFIFIGQKIGSLLDLFPPLEGYALNIIGSLIGTISFALCSYWQTIPTVWFVVCGLLFLWLQRKSLWPFVTTAVIMIGSILIVHTQQANALWSPYYKIQINRMSPIESGSFQLLVNNDQHQLALNLTETISKKDLFHHHWEKIYQYPYRALGRSARRVLVLGSGTGNDVAAALRAGAQQIDAVELDPAIFSLGSKLHPERPYQDPRVRIHINDARHFLRFNQEKYDVVILGWLDSHRLFSTLSSVRQDNFMYTADSFQQVTSHLTDDGVLFLSFYVARGWVAQKIFGMLNSAFGHAPHIYNYPGGGYGEMGHIFSIGKRPSFLPPPIEGFNNLAPLYETLLPSPIPTDDWPYLYYREKSLSKEYASVLGFLLILSILATVSVIPRPIRSQPIHFAFFFLGAGFMLLETKNITKLALIYGSTWQTTSIVVIAVLSIILASIVLIKYGWEPSPRWTWILLFGSLFLSSLWNEQWVQGGPSWAGGVLTTLILSLTFGLSNIIFIRLFATVKNPSLALGLNLLGAVVGGVAEYGTLLVGMRAMYLVVIFFYGAAWLFTKGGPPLWKTVTTD